MSIKKITIVGMGALGVIYGDYLTTKLGSDSVEFVANKDRINKFREDGISCNGRACDFRIVDESEKDKPTDLLIFAVKATGLESAIRTVRNKVSKNTIILSVINGISSEELIGKAYGKDGIIHCVVQGMDVVKSDNKVTYSQFGEFCIGTKEKSKEKNKKLQAVIDLFDQVQMPYRLDEDILHRIWSKFMLNVGINQAAMIYEGNFATFQKPGPARKLMQDAMLEVITLAHKENINLTQKDFYDYVDLIDNMNPEGMPSMRQDGLAHRKSEVEIFSGTVIALAKKYNLDVPVNQKIYDTIIEIEKRY